jgi:hypothetical protein
MTKILILMWDKSHVTLVENDKEFWMKNKINEIHLHYLIGHIRIVAYDYDMIFLVNNGSKWCITMCPNFNDLKYCIIILK